MAKLVSLAALVLAWSNGASAVQEETIAVAGHEGVQEAKVYLPDIIANPKSAREDEQPLSVVLELSGRCQSGTAIEDSMNFKDLVDQRHFVLVVPEARRNTEFCRTCGPPFFGGPGCQAWAATPACCANDGTRSRDAEGKLARTSWEPRDDAAYLLDLIHLVVQRYSVDRSRVYLFGYSAGAFMAQRLACDSPKQIAAVFSLSGGAPLEEDVCDAWLRDTKSPVAMAHMHPLRDSVWPVEGGTFDGMPTPSAEYTVNKWAKHNGCEGEPQALEDLELFRGFPARGTDTTRVAYEACSEGGRVEYWTVPSGTHVGVVMSNRPEFAEAVIDFFDANPKPVSQLPTPGTSAHASTAETLLEEAGEELGA